ncbi:hypothetical protein HXX76_010479 [Chlamydomonas incerta]|uniref:Uncharacterized protein n=1 Tax=Chlamydomonas incerta TaxID=51695 RepID=A0A835SJI5_CHLIN|nr:hypothetical protein HXX76_010479 [Chlamydomonas incerta]|eukprot:KAG2428332.1 hypothetical protein HXX76_010479 [Chlamydomonas incerta]
MKRSSYFICACALVLLATSASVHASTTTAAAAHHVARRRLGASCAPPDATGTVCTMDFEEFTLPASFSETQYAADLGITFLPGTTKLFGAIGTGGSFTLQATNPTPQMAPTFNTKFVNPDGTGSNNDVVLSVPENSCISVPAGFNFASLYASVACQEQSPCVKAGDANYNR